MLRQAPGFGALTAEGLLPFIFALAELFINLESGLLGGGDAEFFGGAKEGKDFAHRLFAGGTFGQFLGIDGAAQGKFAAADLAIPVTEFVFVNWHIKVSGYKLQVASLLKFKFLNYFIFRAVRF